jgi:hypothetical protein
MLFLNAETQAMSRKIKTMEHGKVTCCCILNSSISSVLADYVGQHSECYIVTV